MKKYDNEHDFRRGHRAGSMILAFFIIAFNGVSVNTSIKKFAELVCHKKDFCNFVFGEHGEFCLYCFVIQHYKVTTKFANHQTYNDLYFVELTLFTIGLIVLLIAFATPGVYCFISGAT